jgi:hypothetical protein
MENWAASMENSSAVPQNLKIELPYDPAIVLLEIPKRSKCRILMSYSYALFMYLPAEMWKQQRNQLKKKKEYTHTE